ncbi:MAG: hypothetical protein HYR51_01855 [Candidatus Rokubacteria bacterium]|nr:hypothetical protein [Candidatus Rokubacteria bacterium]
MSSSSSLTVALALWLAWTLATWLLEGLPRTLLRPEATGWRLAYAVIANLGVGLVVAALVARRLVRRRELAAGDAGFGGVIRAALATIVGFGGGAALYKAQGAPVTDAIVLVNVFAQVLTVSAAEIVVCWSVAGAATAAALRGRGAIVSRLAGALVASALFGVHHVAHSPPFDTARMIALLTAVGLVTSVVFFGSRDVLGTIAFHNWLGTFGVTSALVEEGRIAEYARPNVGVVVTAVVTIALVLAVYRAVRQPSPSR